MQVAIYPIKPFDQSTVGTIKYAWSGSQVSVRLIITDNGTQVYDQSTTTNQHVVTIPANILTNGFNHTYSAFITVTDSSGNVSEIQPLGQQFLCLAQPTFEFTNLPTADANGDITIESSSYSFAVTYTQTNNETRAAEKLNSWSITVYNTDKSEVSTSNVQYNVANISNVDNDIYTNTASFSYTFSGFNDDATYYIRAQGETLNGISVDTGYIKIGVSFKLGTIFSILEADNVTEQGSIHVHSNIVSANGELYDSDGNEIDIAEHPEMLVSGDYINPSDNTTTNGQYAVDLRSSSLMYTDGFKLNNDFQIVILLEEPLINQSLFTIYDENGDPYADLYYRIGHFTTTDNQACFELVVYNTTTDSAGLESSVFSLVSRTDTSAITYNTETYTIVSNYFSNVITQPSSGQIGVVLTRRSNSFDIQCAAGMSVTYEASSGGNVG